MFTCHARYHRCDGGIVHAAMWCMSRKWVRWECDAVYRHWYLTTLHQTHVPYARGKQGSVYIRLRMRKLHVKRERAQSTIMPCKRSSLLGLTG